MFQPWITLCGHRNKRNDRQQKKFMIFKQNLFFSIIGNVKKTVWKKYIWMLGCEGLIADIDFLL